MCRQPWLRLDLYDEKGLEDITECGAKLDVPIISDKLYQDSEIWAKQRDRTKYYELYQHWFEESIEYRRGFVNYFYQIVGQCDIAQELDCEWHFGEFKGNSTKDYLELQRL